MNTVADAGLPGISPEDAKQIMPVSQLKRGMRGYGLTVFQGTKIEKFDFEVLGVLKQMNTGKDLILVRIGGGPVNTRQTGVIAGMSGSPCYINGKMIGAIAYGAPYAKEPVGMLTPIADMLEAWDENLPKHASGYSSPQSLSQSMSIGGKTVNKIDIDESGDSGTEVTNGVLHMQPLMMPLMVSGLSQRGIGRLAEILRPFHIQPMAGPGGRGMGDIKASLVPGAAVGVSLATGDIDITGIGTLTYRRGNRIVAFGHPMLSIGAIDAPMTTAYVADVISSYQSSIKLASPIKTVGRVFQDRPWSVAGAVGSMPKTIPLKIAINDQAFGRNRTYKVNVINHPLLASRLISLILGEAIFETHSTPGDATAEVTYEAVADQIGKITRTNVFFDPAAIDMAAVSDIGMLLRILSSNRFYPLDIQSVNVKIRIIAKRNTATIDRIFVKKNEFEPGEKVEVGVVLRPYKQNRVTKTFSVKIPATAANGKIVLQVRGGGTTMPSGALIESGPSDEEDGPPMTMPVPGMGSGIANADNIRQLVDKFLEREKNNEVVVQLLMHSTAINVAGEKLTGMPSAIADVMKSSRNSGLKMERDEVKEVFTDDMIVYGSARLTLDVKQKSLNESKPGPKIDPPMPGDGEPDISPTSGPDELDVDPLSASTRGSQMTAMAVDEEPLAPEPEEPAVVEKDNRPSEEPKDEKPAEVENTKLGDLEKPAPAEKVKTDVKTVVRQAKTWSQRTQADFSKGTFSGVSASSENKLELVPTLRKLVETPEQFVWCLAPARDGVYAGTGNSGKIYHVSDDGEIKVFYETGELEVHSLARDSAGNIYAGTSPRGKIFKITPDGKGSVLYKAAEKYILALAVDGEGNVYAGVGDGGKVYRITPSGDAGVFTEINEQQILSLHWDVHGSLLVGTGINGVVYKVDKHGKVEPVFDAAEASITSVLSDGDGNIYAGTSPKGIVYKITPDGRSEAVFTKANRVLSMTVDDRNNVYAVSDGSLVKIAPDKTVIYLDSSKDKVQFLAVTYSSPMNALYAGTGNTGSVYVSKCCDIAGTFESAVHDAKMPSRWGRVKWVAETPEGASVQIQTRAGNVETPDATWSDWSRPYTNASGEQITGTAARYIQYRITLKTQNVEVSPKVSSVTISYLTPNQKPTVKLTEPVGGAVWSASETIRWTGSDPDKDNLTYDVFYSNDGSKEWTALMGGVTGGSNGNGKSKTESDIIGKIKSEIEKSPDVPEDMKKQIIKEADGGKKPSESEKAVTPASSKTSHKWDTAKVEDGAYVLKIVASDRTSNASDALTDEVVSESFVICNTPPKLVVYKTGTELKAAGSATITGSATSKLVEIAGVQYRVDGGEWAAAVAEDGVFDSPYETFSLTTDKLDIGAHKVEVQAIDMAGNASSEIVEVKVS